MKNKMETKSYITLRDREWKGKEWFTSYISCKNIRKLTDEEAKPFLENGTIQEVVLPTYEKDIVNVIDGRIVCAKCGSKQGFYIKKNPFGKKVNIFTCVNCGIREIRKRN